MGTQLVLPVIGRLAGLDFGLRRIGLALSDETQTIASPQRALKNPPDPRAAIVEITTFATSRRVVGFVVGLPLNMDGTSGPQAERTRRFAEHLRAESGLPVELWDERLSTFAADVLLNQAGLRRRARDRRRDALAAQQILQSFLDARRRPEPSP